MKEGQGQEKKSVAQTRNEFDSPLLKKEKNQSIPMTEESDGPILVQAPIIITNQEPHSASPNLKQTLAPLESSPGPPEILITENFRTDDHLDDEDCLRLGDSRNKSNLSPRTLVREILRKEAAAEESNSGINTTTVGRNMDQGAQIRDVSPATMKPRTKTLDGTSAIIGCLNNSNNNGQVVAVSPSKLLNNRMKASPNKALSIDCSNLNEL